MLTQDEIGFYNDHGYLHLPGIFGASEVQALAEELDWLIGAWANRSPGWSGDWRRAYMDEELSLIHI